MYYCPTLKKVVQAENEADVPNKLKDLKKKTKKEEVKNDK